MISKHIKSDRGTALLAELKSLVDSFPNDQRKEVIKIFRSVFTLAEGYHYLTVSADENISFKDREA